MRRTIVGDALVNGVYRPVVVYTGDDDDQDPREYYYEALTKAYLIGSNDVNQN